MKHLFRSPLLFIGRLHALPVAIYAFAISQSFLYALFVSLLFGSFEAFFWRFVLARSSRMFSFPVFFAGAANGLFVAFLIGFLFALHLQIANHDIIGLYSSSSRTDLSYTLSFGLLSLLFFFPYSIPIGITSAIIPASYTHPSRSH